jgi:hypothetical protein
MDWIVRFLKHVYTLRSVSLALWVMQYEKEETKK